MTTERYERNRDRIDNQPSVKQMKEEIKRLRHSPYPADRKQLAKYEKKIKGTK